jgi:hypothetical protein
VLAVVYAIVESSPTCCSCPQHRDNHQSSPDPDSFFPDHSDHSASAPPPWLRCSVARH